MQNQIAIVDYGIGNLNSIRKKLTRLKINSIISSDPKEIQNSGKIILTGIGHFQKAMEHLKELNLTTTLNEEVLIKKNNTGNMFRNAVNGKEK